jgi:hypothetical protein
VAEIAGHGGPAGAPPKKSLPDAYQELLEALFYANHVFEDEEDCGRQGIVIACHAVARFIAVNHENPHLAAPLLAMRAALLGLEKGVTNPIIDSSSGDGRRSRSSLKKHAIAVAGACLEALVELGDPLDEAASRVARYASKWRGMGDQEVTATTIKNWRSTLRALPAYEHRPFDLMRKDLLTCGDPRGKVEALLRSGPPGIPKT